MRFPLAIRKRIGSSMHWLDDAYGWVASRPRFYRGGFGELVEPRLETLRPLPITVTWDDAEASGAGVRVRHGAFESPHAEGLPPAARRARFQLLLPRETKASTPVMLHLAATGAEGFGQRRRIALPLARSGIGALLLENPYYGSRRPPGQRAVALETVGDQLRMNAATVVEGLSLLEWLKTQGFRRLGVTGFSMGGVMAAIVGGLFEGPLAVVPVAGAVSMAPLFLDGVLGRAVRWDVLGREAGGHEAARKRLENALDSISAARVPRPRRPEATLLWAARHDGFVPASAVEPFARLWPGIESRWAETGHVAGFLRRLPEWHEAIRIALEKL